MVAGIRQNWHQIVANLKELADFFQELHERDIASESY